MKKKLGGLILALMFVFTGMFLTACKSRYNKLEFNIQYAFVEEDGNISEWANVGQTLSLNYGNEEKDKLKIENGKNNLVFKVEVKNVKAKYIDDIIVFDSENSSSQIVKQGENFHLNFANPMQTKIRIYETKSNKETSFNLNIFESLQEITTNTGFKPAIEMGNENVSVDLNKLVSVDPSVSSLLFYPIGTNQTGVNFEVDGLGYYGQASWVPVKTNADMNLNRNIKIENGILSVSKDYFSTLVNAPILKIKATSVIYEDKSAKFDILFVQKLQDNDGSNYTPVLRDNGATTETALTKKILYVNDNKGGREGYKTVVKIDLNTIKNNSKFVEGVKTADNAEMKYDFNVYVDNELVDMDDYIDHNGLRIQPLESGSSNVLLFEIVANDKTYLTHPKNEVKFEMVLNGLDFIGRQTKYSANLTIEKQIVVENITINGEMNLVEGKIYSTGNENVANAGLDLLVDVLPKDNIQRAVLISVPEGLKISGRAVSKLDENQWQTIGGNIYKYSIINGSQINVQFDENATATELNLNFMVAKIQGGNEYITHTFKVSKVVTASEVSVYATSSCDLTNYTRTDEPVLMNATSENNFYLKLVYHGNTLATETIDLTLQDGGKFAFKNGKTSINLKEDFTSADITTISTGSSGNGAKFVVFSVPLRATNEKASTRIKISVAKQGNLALFEETFSAQSVYVADNADFVITTEGKYLKNLTNDEDDFDKLAVVNNSSLRSEIYFGQEINGEFSSQTTAKVSIELETNVRNENYSPTAVSLRELGNADNVTKFQIWGTQAGKFTIFKAKITYYKSEEGLISATTADKYFEVAVYNAISDISLNFASNYSDTIVYINQYYETVAKTQINFSAKSMVSVPATKLVFSTGELDVAVNTISLELTGDTSGYVDISVNDGDIVDYDNVGLNGSFVVKLVGKPIYAQKFVGLKLTAKTFDEQILTKSIVVNFGEYSPSNGIKVSGDSIQNKNGEPYIYMSFMDVADNGSVSTEFNTEVTYDTTATIKYDDIGFKLYEQVYNNGKPVIDDDGTVRLNEITSTNKLKIQIDKTTHTVKVVADKTQGGGNYELHLYALDSFDGADFKNICKINIVVADGTMGKEFRIATDSDFKKIKDNLSSHFVLENDLTIATHETFGNFSGSLSGVTNDIINGQLVESKPRKLNLTITGFASQTDNRYLGLFAKMVNEAKLSNLVLNVKFDENLVIRSNTNETNLYIGGVAGQIENGAQITNVEITTDFSNITFAKDNIATDVFIGGVAGEMACAFDVASSRVTAIGSIKASVDNKTLRIGGVAGKLNSAGSIKGNYTKPSDIENLTYNVGLSLTFVNATSEGDIPVNNINIGGVVGELERSATVEGVIIMGQIDARNLTANGGLAGVAGKANGTIKNVLLLGVDIVADYADVIVAGVAGVADQARIENAKVLSFNLEDAFNSGIVLGKDKHGFVKNSLGTVAGIVGKAKNSTITASSVENYVKDTSFNMLNGKTVYGIAQSEGATITKCFVNAFVNAESASYFISNGSFENCYFIGRAVGAFEMGTGTTSYYVVYNDSNVDVNGVSLTGLTDADKNNEKQVSVTGIEINEIWAQTLTYNVVRVGEYVLSFPYLKDVYTLIPTEITIKLKEDIKGLYLNNYNHDETDGDKTHTITETIVVNYYNNVLDPLSNNIENNTYNLTDLLTLKKVPTDSIGAIVYKILKGGNYASIIDNAKIYFKGATGGDNYILIKAYSIFNPDACDYFVIYTQHWYTDIVVEGSDIYAGAGEYQLNTYKGAENIKLNLASENLRQGDNSIYKSLFDVNGVENFVSIEYALTNNYDADHNQIVSIAETSVLGNYILSTNKNATIDRLKEVTITFTISLNLTKYFGASIYPQTEGVDQFEVIAVKTLKCTIIETATLVEVDIDTLEGESKDGFNINAVLHTEYVNGTAESLTSVTVGTVGNVVNFDEQNHDSLAMEFSLINGQTELNRLFTQSGVSSIVELFDFNITNNYNPILKTYTYNIRFELKSEYKYRYLKDTITFGIKLYSQFNTDVKTDVIQLTIKPSSVSSGIVLNNYVADATTMGNYTHIITTSQIETANITPGGNGGVLVVNMQPSYANILTATIKSSELFVPSLNQSVKVRFEQIVYHTGIKKYISISPICEPTDDDMGINLRLATATSDGVNYTYDGIIYIHVVLDKKFSGLADEITLTLDVTDSNGTHVVKTKSLITDFLPGVNLSYDEKYATSAQIAGEDVNGYLVQQNTVKNVVDVTIYGYQFNANPMAEIFDLSDNPVTANVDCYWIDRYSELKPNADGSYTMRLAVNLRNEINAPFKVKVRMELVTNGALTSEAKEVVFFPVNYLLVNADTNIMFNSGSNLSLALNQASDIEFNFATLSNTNNYSTEIYKILLANLAGKSVDELERLTAKEKVSLFETLKTQFSYINGNSTSNFVDTNEYFEMFTTNYGSGADNLTYLRLKAKGKLDTSASFHIYYGYTQNADGVFELTFSTVPSKFELNIPFKMQFFTATTRQDAFAISSAEQMFDANGNCILGAGQNYVLTNDIVVENIKPITTAIGSLDGNNKKIIVKSFAVDASNDSGSQTSGDFGLFATVSESTMLYNVVVDYSQFNTDRNGQLVLSYENLNTIVFGGLAGVNNGLIYNCDVVNANRNSVKVVNLLVNNSAETEITFGGLVGVNNGTITNSRVGRNSFTKIVATDANQTSYTETFNQLSFIIGNRTLDAGQGFKSTIGGFVGINNSDATISSSYIANTSLYTYSTNAESRIAGFVAENAGDINYCFVKANENTITNETAFSTGAKIESYADGNIAGFVYDNNSGASITNSFANIELVSKSAFMAGFVFKNNSGASISQCYSACTFANADRDTSLQITPEQPFVGADSTGLYSNGELENCYWYKDASQSFVVFTDDDMPQAIGLDASNFKNPNNLVNFVFVQSNSKADREQGIWSYYNSQNVAVKLPELNITNNIAHSYRYKSANDADGSWTYATKFALGSANNPHIISSVQEFNDTFTSYGTKADFQGYARFVKNIDFANDKQAIETRRNFTLGANPTSGNVVANSVTSIDGNGLNIDNIYLDVGVDVETAVGLFAEIKYAYIKNINLNFSAGEFSTANATYSGGLAGRISNSVVVNVNLNGTGTTIQGKNVVGGLAGMVEGQSLVYSVSSNLSVTTINSNTEEVYVPSRKANNENYVNSLSYAGGIVGVVDVSTRAFSTDGFNFAYLYINDNGVQTNESLQIVADFAGGVAGYVGKEVKSARLTFNPGAENRINGQFSAGGLFGVSVGASVEASKVSASDTDDAQFKYDNTFAKYIIEDCKNALDTENIGNASLIESYTYGGGLIGLSIGSNIYSCYSKASFYAGNVIGGLVGFDMQSSINYDYAVPYINFAGNMDELTTVGGLIGMTASKTYSKYASIYASIGRNDSAYQNYTFSTILLDVEAYKAVKDNYTQQPNMNWFVGNFVASNYATQNAYYGAYNYPEINIDTAISGTSRQELKTLYNLDELDAQKAVFDTIFSIWDTTYWNLDTRTHYFPLLTDISDNNDEIIAEANDFNKIKNNPNGSYKIIDDIKMEDYTSSDPNYVFPFTFKGVLFGEKPDGSTPKIYGLNVKASNLDNAGLFKATENATFRNIEFSWMSKGVGNNSDKNVNIKNFGGLSCTDTNSKISAVNVTVGQVKGERKAGEFKLFKENSTITGFGGLIANATGSNIVNSGFSGVVNATVDTSVNTSNIGGIVGNGQTVTDLTVNYENVMTIIGCSVGNLQDTIFDITLTTSGTAQSTQIGLLAGSLANSAIQNNAVGNIISATNKASKIVLTQSSNSGNAYVAGLVGFIDTCTITNNYTLNEIEVKENNAINADLFLAGLVANYQLTTGRERSITQANVQTTITSNAENKNTYASAGVSYTTSNLTMEQCVLTGSISVQGNSTLGGAVGAVFKPEGETKIPKLTLSELVSNVNLNATEDAEADKTFYIGGLAGRVEGEMLLNNTLNLGKIKPNVKANDVSYYIGGVAGYVHTIMLKQGSFSFNLSSILANELRGETITATDNRKIGALFGELNKTDGNHNMFVYTEAIDGTLTTEQYLANGTNGAEIFYSTDVNLQPEDSFLGKNLTYSTLSYNSQVYLAGYDNQVWHATSNDNTTDNGVPYIASLLASMQQYGIMQNGYEKYVSGLAVNPRASVGNETTGYFLIDSGVEINREFNGIIVGGDNLTENVRIGTLGADGALSNIHINHKDATNVKALVTNNSGTVFNCTVLGNVLGMAENGLIVETNTNTGLIAYCGVSADVEPAGGSDSISGVAYTNAGTISSTYFTGYINGKGVGFAGVVQDGAYFYNNYMAGVVTNAGANNPFAGANKINGKNNFVDYYANLKLLDSFIGKENSLTSGALTLVPTFGLMDNNITKRVGFDGEGEAILTDVQGSTTKLDGKWQTTVKRDETNITSFDLTADTFGHNYNYPIYNFNIQTVVSTQSGVNTIGAQSLSKYARKTGEGSSNLENNSFQVPHLGVLNSIQGVLATGSYKYYKLTHSIEARAENSNDLNYSELYKWAGVGNFEGFTKAGFKGYFDGDNKVITGLCDKGIFNDIVGGKNDTTETTITNVKVGKMALIDSGALAQKVTGKVNVTNCNFASAEINGNNTALMFGKIDENADVKLSGITTAETNLSTSVATLNLNDGNFGIVASSMNAGTVKISDSDINVVVTPSGGNATFGGLVGVITNGTIEGESKNRTNLHISIGNDKQDLKTLNMFGGLVGEMQEGNVTIKYFNVKLEKVDSVTVTTTSYEPQTEIDVAKFGGLLGSSVSGTINFNTCAFNSAQKDNAQGASTGNNIKIVNAKSFGLVCAELTGTVNVSTISATNTYTVEDKTNEPKEDEKTSGVGGLVGVMNGGASIIISEFKEFKPTINAVKLSNVGGFVGLLKVGEGLTATFNFDNESKSEVKIKLSGAVNVGGAIGYALANPTCATDSWNFFNNNNGGEAGEDERVEFAELSTASMAVGTGKAENTTFKNWGGLVGKSESTISGAVNSNKITISTANKISTIMNFGGVVGYCATGNLIDCKNYGSIIINSSDGKSAFKTDANDFYELSRDTTSTATLKPINIGGIAGKADGNIENCINKVDIVGYQNVGGVVGYSAGLVTGKFTEEPFNKDKWDNGTIYYMLDGGNNYTALDNDTAQKIINKEEGFTDIKTYIVDGAELSNSVAGAINVGGVVGYLGSSANSKGAIEGITVTGDVYGNTNVGGVVGLTGTGVSVRANQVGKTEEGQEPTYINIKAVFVRETVTGSKTKKYYVLPTSVGGVIGYTGDNNTIAGNAVYANITSTEESAENGNNNTDSSTVISTISNYMYTTEANDVEELVQLDFSSEQQLPTYKKDFNSIQTGFGGFIGTTNASISGKVETNKIQTTINAGAGVNVGTYYGVYSLDSEHTSILLPELMAVNSATQEGESTTESSVSGAYNIGGVIGYLFGGQHLTDGFTLTPKHKISVQKNGVGMYVGGVFGKVNGNIQNIKVEQFEGKSNLEITTDNSYYVGGIVGRLEGNLTEANITTKDEKGNDKSTIAIADTGDDRENFGGLVGILKVTNAQKNSAGNAGATVKGLHTYPFTVNTIENENYFDADSNFEAIEDDNDVTLHAMAYYVNQDNFEISASKGEEFDHNPLYNSEDDKVLTYADTEKGGTKTFATATWNTQGWHDDYTGFKTLQRCIPKDQNNGAEWDSIATIYDASKIKAVATVNDEDIDNVFYTSEEVGKIKYTIYEAYDNRPTLYSKYGMASVYSDPQTGRVCKKEDGTLYKPSVIENDEEEPGINDDCFIVNNFVYINDDIYTNSEAKLTKMYSSIYFEYVARFASDCLSTSGSIFQVDGGFKNDYISPSQKENNKRLQDELTKWNNILKGVAIGVAIISAICTIASFFTAGASSAGTAAANGGYLVVKKSAWVVIKKVIKKCVTKVASLFSKKAIMSGVLRLSSGLLALGMLHYISLQFQYSSQSMSYEMSLRMSQYEKASSSGYLSNMYYMDIEYDENGKLMTSADKVQIINGQAYQLYSTVRPVDYYTNYWIVYDENLNKLIPKSVIDDVSTYIEGETRFKTYVFNDGYYWVHALYTDLDYTSVNLFNNSQYSQDIERNSQPWIYTIDNRKYVYGNYTKGETDGEYSLTTRTDNLLIYTDDKQYKLNGKIIADNLATKTSTLNYKLYTDSEEQAEDGYKVLKNAYYTTLGTKFKDSTVKYGIFKNNWTSKPNGTLGVDYIEQAGYVTSNDGNYFKYDSKYYLIDNYRYSYDKETGNYSFDSNGNFVKVGDVYIDITTISKYKEAPCYYTIESISDTRPEEQEDCVIIELYPASFSNPYATSISNSQDTNTYVYTADTSNTIKHDATYFLWEGGYIVNDNKPFIYYGSYYGNGYYKDSDGNIQKVTSESLITFDDGNSVDITKVYNGESANGIDASCVNKYLDGDKFGDYYYVENYEATLTIKNDETIMVDEYRIYQYSASYCLGNPNNSDSPNWLYKVRVKAKEATGEDYNYNKFLSNADHEFYTRYKFTEKGSTKLPDEFYVYEYDNHSAINNYLEYLGDLVTGDFTENIFTGNKNKSNTKYNLYAEQGDPNSGTNYSTQFCESVRVLISGNYMKKDKGNWGKVKEAGSISISNE